MSHDDRRPVDPVTGYETTGHEWNGIIELNTPFPRSVVWALALAFGFSVAAWILLPAWPTGSGYTPGLLGLSQATEAEQGLKALVDDRARWRDRFASRDFQSLKSDAALMAVAMPAAGRLFADNCAACHGQDGRGGPGFPSLAGGAWLWGGDPPTIAETVAVGINGTDPDTRVSQMPAFGNDGLLKPDQIEAVADYVVSLTTGNADPASVGGKIFAESCVACHGEGGRGGLRVGAPPLTSHDWIHGGTRSAIVATLRYGRQGVMPSWRGRLGATDINLLALYVSGLSRRAAADVER